MATKKLKPEALPAEIAQAPIEVRQEAVSLIKDTCKKIGMGLEDYLVAIKDGLKADKLILDKTGAGTYEPDHLIRLKAALMGMEAEGYLKAKSEGNVTNNYQPVVMQIIQKINDAKRAASSTRVDVLWKPDELRNTCVSRGDVQPPRDE
jgi:hypothetical protein